MPESQVPVPTGTTREWLDGGERTTAIDGGRSKRKPLKGSSRLPEFVRHIPHYWFRTQARLAKDSGVSAATVSRAMRGAQPTVPHALQMVEALSRRFGKPLDVREIFSPDGTYPTPSVCDLLECSGRGHLEIMEEGL